MFKHITVKKKLSVFVVALFIVSLATGTYFSYDQGYAHGYIQGLAQAGGTPTIDGTVGIYDMPWVNGTAANFEEFYLNNELLSQSEIASYIIFNASNRIWAKNGLTGHIEYGGIDNKGGVSGLDAQEVIQIVSENAENGKVLLKNGMYFTDSVILIKSKNGFVLEGESWGAKIIPNGDHSAIRFGGSTGEECINTTIKNLCIDGSNQATASDTPPNEGNIKLGIFIYIGSSVIVDNCYLFNTGSDSIYALNPSFCSIKNNLIEKNRGWYGAIHTHGNNYNFYVINNVVKDSVGGIRHGNVIVGNRILNITGDMPGIFGGAEGSTIVGNHLENMNWNGIEVFGNYTVVSSNYIAGFGGRYGVETATYSNSIVTGNTITNFLRGINTASGYWNVIDSNNIKNCGRGIHFGDENSVISNNVIHNVTDEFIFIQDKNENIIIGNIFDLASKDGIYFRGHRTKIIGNQIKNVNQLGSTYRSIKLDAYSDNNTISGNIFLTDTPNTPDALIILWGDGNCIYDNDFRMGNPSGAIINDLGTNTKIYDNLGFITENTGTSTLLNGQTSIIVSHGCDYTPSAGDISVHPMESLGSASYWYVDTITATQFMIHVNADPGQDIDFAWSFDRH